MKRYWLAVSVLFALALGAPAYCAGIPETFTGTLASPEDTAEFVVTLPTAGTIVLQTYGFGGGTNAAGTLIAPGGTDPFLAIFSGTGGGATIVTDGSGNPFGTSLDLSNYDNPSFLGCPPAKTATIGGGSVCGDITMTPSLSAGVYTVLLSDGQYQPDAVFDNGTLGEGFTDFTGGQFCNVVINDVDCPNTSGAYALDMTMSGSVAPVPEPGKLSLFGGFLCALGLLYRGRHLGFSRPQRLTISGRKDF